MAGLNHERVVDHGDKGLAEDWNKDHKQKGNHDCEQFQHLNHVWENRTDWPAGPVAGQIVYRTDFNSAFFWDGTVWQGLQSVATIIVAADGSGHFLTIQEGIDALPVGGGVVYVKEGTYAITAAISITSDNVSLVGAGKSCVITSANNISIISVSGVGSVTVDAFYLVDTDATVLSAAGVNFLNSVDSTVRNCWFNCKNKYGVRLQGTSTNVLVNGNIFADDTRYGVESTIASTIIVSNNVFTGSVQRGVSFGLVSRGIVTNNLFDNLALVGIQIINANLNLVSNNVFYSSGSYQVYIDGTSSRNIVNNNIIINGSSDGIRITGAGCVNNLIDGNVIYNNVGVAITNNGTNTQIAHNITS